MPKSKIPSPIIGTRFGRLLITTIYKMDDGRTGVICKCDCGKQTRVRYYYLVKGRTQSCGCFNVDTSRQRFTKHGGKGTRLYRIWKEIKRRCYNPRRPQFKDWGGRGITVCNEWHDDFAAFRDWAISHGYQDDLEIDRINNDGNYEPNNCRWVNRITNARNRRMKHLLTAFGETKSMVEWSEDIRCKVKYDTLQSRINYYGWDTERAITILPRRRSNSLSNFLQPG